MNESAAKRAVIEAGLRLVQNGLVERTWGNVSCRIDEKRFAITPSGMGYDRPTENDIVVVDCETLLHLGDVRPSSEKGIHAAAYRTRPNVGFVIHTHQTYATLVSIVGTGCLSMTAEDAEALGGPVTAADYGMPGSKALCSQVEKEMALGGHVILMARHGLLSMGADAEEAFSRAALTETLCQQALANLALPRVGVRAPFPPADAEAITAELHKRRPTASVLTASSEAVGQLTGSRLPAMLDDFAQMVGCCARIVPRSADLPKAVAAAFGSRSAVVVQGLGTVSMADCASDAAAAAALTEKNALAVLAAKRYDRMKPLSLRDAVALRLFYLYKYSKRK